MSNAFRCTTCATKRGKMVPGHCTECPNGTHMAMVQLCSACTTAHGNFGDRCEVCKAPLPTTCNPPSKPHTTSSFDGMAGPTGMGGC